MTKCKWCSNLRVLFMSPVLQSKLQQGVVHALSRERFHLYHVFQEGPQLSWVVGKDWDELFRVGL